MILKSLLHRLRLIWLSRVGGRSNAGQLVFEFCEGSDLEPVPITQLEYVEAKALSAWKDGKMMAHWINVDLDAGATFYAILDDAGLVRSFILSKPGPRVEPWYIPLKENDVVYLSANTHPSERGKRLMARMVATVSTELKRNGGRVLLDCAAWNIAAHRTFEAAGFRRIRDAPFQPLPDRSGT